MISKEKLKKLYEQEKKSVKEIADICKVSKNTVYIYLDQYGIRKIETTPSHRRKRHKKIDLLRALGFDEYGDTRYIW